jgi:hypothetical protein
MAAGAWGVDHLTTNKYRSLVFCCLIKSISSQVCICSGTLAGAQARLKVQGKFYEDPDVPGDEDEYYWIVHREALLVHLQVWLLLI